MQQAQRNPWKVATFAILATLGAVLVAGAVVARLSREPAPASEEAAAAGSASAPSSASAAATGPPPRRVVEDCNRYAAAAKTDAGRVAKDGLIGGAIGAGIGAAGGAIAKGGKGAGKGAGIGALVGATGGVLYGINAEHKDNAAARRAYEDCLARNGYL